MPRRTTLSNAFGKGVLDPHLSERIDLAHYYQSLAEAENVMFAPQGGVADRGGTALISDPDLVAAGIERRLRHRLEPVHLTAAMLTATNGGNKATLLDLNPETVMITGALNATPFVVLDVDLGAAVRISAVDVIGFALAAYGVNDCLAVEYYDGAVWRDFVGLSDIGRRRHMRQTDRTRRFAGWPGTGIEARYFRIVVYGAVGAGPVTLRGLRFWTETAALSPLRDFTVARSSDDHYILVLSHRNIDVYRNHRFLAAIPVPIAAQQVERVSIESSLDTVLLLHEQVETIHIERQGSDGEWNAAPVTWTNVPTLSITTAYSGSQDEIQSIGLGGITPGSSVILALGDVMTAPIAYANDAAWAAAAATALATIAGVTPGDVQVAVTAPTTFRVSFVATAGSRSWPLVEPMVVGGSQAPDTIVSQIGLDASEGALMWSARTGWPRCGAFVQSRLMIAGFRAAPSTWRVSVVGDYWSFLGVGSPATADRAFGGALDVDEVEGILHLFVGRHVQIFTNAGEWFLETRTLDATQPVNAVLATRVGGAPGVVPTFLDGTTLFVQKGGETLHEFSWAEAEQSYRSDPLSVLGPHLLKDVRVMSARAARSVREGNQGLLINGDGTAALLTLLRSQDVVAIAPWSTPHGAFRSVCVSIDYSVTFIVERDGVLRLERWVPEMPLDCATRVEGVGLTTVGGLPFPDGREVWAYCDDDLYGPLVVNAGEVTLPVAASVAIVGLAPAFRARLPVVRPKPNEDKPWKPPMRIYGVDLALDRTGDITIATNGREHRRVPLLKHAGGLASGGPLVTPDGGNPLLPLMQRLWTGNRSITGLTGWTTYPFIELSREVPAPVRVKSVRLEVAHG